MRSFFILAATVVVAVGQACFGAGTQVRFMGQTNLIVWDDKNGIEHFVRDASFSTPSKDLGFIAPTPTEPELGEVKPGIFAFLESLNPAPRAASFGLGGGGFGGGRGSVQVLQEKFVGGYKATVLRADDGTALYNWLDQNGYKVTLTSRPWLEFYVKKNWCFTAFKVEKSADNAAVKTGPVRLSFRTKQPYNPYYVPADNLPKEYAATNRLAVYFVARGRYQGNIGSSGNWDGAPEWKVALTDATRKSLADNMKMDPGAIPTGATLTKFVDPFFPRPARDDVFFKQMLP